MKTLDRYILLKTLWPLLATAGVALLGLLLERSVRVMDLIVNKGGPLYLVLRMLANLLPHYLGMALPAAFFIGVLLTAMRLTNDSEIDASYASGVSLQRMIAPIMALAVLLVVVSAVLFGYLQPHTRYGFRALVYLATETSWNAAVEQGAFFTGVGNTTLMAQDIEEGGRRLSGIFVYEREADGTMVTTTAERGSVSRSPGDLNLILSLDHGVRVRETPGEARPVLLTFDRLELPLDTSLDVKPFRSRGEGERELTLSELWRFQDRPPEGTSASSMNAELHARLVRTLTPLCLPLLGFAIGVAGRRAKRGAALTVGIIVIVLYHHVLLFGQELADANTLPPIVALWGPFIGLAALSLWLFRGAALHPGFSPAAGLLNFLGRAFSPLAWRSG